MIGVERRITDNTRIIDLTVGELKELFSSLVTPVKDEKEKRYDYGMAGFARSLNISISYANKLKATGRFDEAIKQEGRKIMVDVDKLIEIYGSK